MTETDWQDGERRTLAFMLSGEAGHYHLTERGAPEYDDTFYVILNASDQAVECRTPSPPKDCAGWRVLVDTSLEKTTRNVRRLDSDGGFRIKPRSLLLTVAVSGS